MPSRDAGQAVPVRSVVIQMNGQVRSLWFSPDGQTLLAVTADEAALIDRTGRRRWTWTRPAAGEIHSAHFASDGGAVLVAAGRAVHRLQTDTGKSRRWFRTRAPGLDTDDIEAVSSVFWDDLVPLPNGALAYSLVRTRVQPEGEEDQ